MFLFFVVHVIFCVKNGFLECVLTWEMFTFEVTMTRVIC